jgi:hypothetical protein
LRADAHQTPFGPGELAGDASVERQRASALDRERRGDGDHEQVELEALASLGARPVHEEPERPVHRGDCADHQADHRQRDGAREQPQHEEQGAEELEQDDARGEGPGQADPGPSGTRASLRSRSRPPAQELLGSVREHHRRERDRNTVAAEPACVASTSCRGRRTRAEEGSERLQSGRSCQDSLVRVDVVWLRAAWTGPDAVQELDQLALLALREHRERLVVLAGDVLSTRSSSARPLFVMRQMTLPPVLGRALALDPPLVARAGRADA